MYECTSCGATLRFDIASQQMLCSFCDNKYDPYEAKDRGYASENQYLEVTIYTCTQCGGEIGGLETSAAEFCSFCGSPVVLESRLSKMKKPKYIIPFKKTKEESAQNFKKQLKKKFFLPKAFKDGDVDDFRGIYMPCWSYNVYQKGKTVLKLEKEETEGGYTKVYQYDMPVEIDAEYHGIPHDASSSFSDKISETLEPYHYKDRKPFIPAFLSGFFSDIKDIEESKYEKEAVEIANQNTYRQVMSQLTYDDGDFSEQDKKFMSAVFRSKLGKTDVTLVPVWFLSYRKGNRVAYATVNGETGKVVSDTPIDIMKVWIMALLLAIPLFFAFNTTISMKAGTLLFASLAFLFLTCLLSFVNIERMIKQEELKNWERAEKEKDKVQRKAEKKKEKSKLPIGWIIFGILAVLIVGAILWFVLVLAVALAAALAALVGIILVGGGSVICPIFGYFAYRKEKFPISVMPCFLFMVVTALASDVILIAQPVSDAYYYGAVMGNLFAILFLLSSILRGMNILSTRPLPQFEVRGGAYYE